MNDPRSPRVYCQKCGPRWRPRKTKPHTCPKCKYKRVLPLGADEINPMVQRERPSGS